MELVHELRKTPARIERVLHEEKAIKKIANKYFRARDFLFLARGINYPVALEGALKLKELSYIHAEGYPAGEMKHGPIALIDEFMPVVFLAPMDAHYPKVVANMEEVKARGGRDNSLRERRGYRGLGQGRRRRGHTARAALPDAPCAFSAHAASRVPYGGFPGVRTWTSREISRKALQWSKIFLTEGDGRKP